MLFNKGPAQNKYERPQYKDRNRRRLYVLRCIYDGRTATFTDDGPFEGVHENWQTAPPSGTRQQLFRSLAKRDGMLPVWFYDESAVPSEHRLSDADRFLPVPNSGIGVSHIEIPVANEQIKARMAENIAVREGRQKRGQEEMEAKRRSLEAENKAKAEDVKGVVIEALKDVLTAGKSDESKSESKKRGRKQESEEASDG